MEKLTEIQVWDFVKLIILQGFKKNFLLLSRLIDIHQSEHIEYPHWHISTLASISQVP
jgi:hypothetical protein